MAPKEKAEELVNKFRNSSGCLEDQVECALICVDECIDTLDVNIMDFEKCFHAIKFWQEVKEELNKLKSR